MKLDKQKTSGEARIATNLFGVNVLSVASAGGCCSLEVSLQVKTVIHVQLEKSRRGKLSNVLSATRTSICPLLATRRIAQRSAILKDKDKAIFLLVKSVIKNIIGHHPKLNGVAVVFARLNAEA